MRFESLLQILKTIDEHLRVQSLRAVNINLTLRNWLIGWHIAEYELNGEDRSGYGEALFSTLSEQLSGLGLSNCNRRQLYRYRDFYRVYPDIVGTLSPKLLHLLPETHVCEKVGTSSPLSGMLPEHLLNSLSYSHFELLIGIEDRIKRTFYEMECIQGNWSVRELKRQIATLYFERSDLSRSKGKLLELVRASAETDHSFRVIRDPYVFEFLGIKPREIMHESDIESALLVKLQDFLLELGRGFCFEARQKRILIGGVHFFVDLVFYHRILKCHILIELKVDGFSHEYLGQLNTYVNWYREHETSPGDNPPMGILMCTEKNHALVRYALAGMDNHLFVSKYQLQLPDEQEMRTFIEQNLIEAVSET